MGSQVLYIKAQNRGILKVLWVAAGTMGGPPPDPPREDMLPRTAPPTQRAHKWPVQPPGAVGADAGDFMCTSQRDMSTNLN